MTSADVATFQRELAFADPQGLTPPIGVWISEGFDRSRDTSSVSGERDLGPRAANCGTPSRFRVSADRTALHLLHRAAALQECPSSHMVSSASGGLVGFRTGHDLESASAIPSPGILAAAGSRKRVIISRQTAAARETDPAVGALQFPNLVANGEISDVRSLGTNRRSVSSIFHFPPRAASVLFPTAGVQHTSSAKCTKFAREFSRCDTPRKSRRHLRLALRTWRSVFLKTLTGSSFSPRHPPPR